MPRQTFIGADFTGGLNDSLDPDRLKDNELSECSNFRPNLTGNLKSRDGQEKVSTSSLSTAGTAHITGFFEAELSTGTISAIATVDTDAVTGQRFYHLTNANVKTVIPMTVTGNANTKWRWVFFNNLFVGVSPGWAPTKWAGSATATAQVLGGTVSASITAPSDIAIWNSRICMSQGVDLYISDTSEAEDWLGGDAQVLRFRGATFGEEAITAIYPFQGKLIVFKRSSIWVVDSGGGPSRDWVVKQIGFGIGCDARLSIADIGRDLIFLSGAGFNSLADIQDRGGLSVDGRLSQKINRTIISNISPANLDNAVGVYNPEREEYLCSIPSTAATTNNTSVMNLSVRWTNTNKDPAWFPSTYNKNITAFCRRKSAGLDRIQTGNIDGNLYDITSDTNDDDGTVINKNMQTKRFPFESFINNKVFQKVSVDITQEQSFDVNIIVRINDNSRTKSYVTDIVGAGAKYDTSSWDSADWVNVFKGADRRDIYYVGRNIQIEISESNALQSLTVNKIMVEYEPIQEDLAL